MTFWDGIPYPIQLGLGWSLVLISFGVMVFLIWVGYAINTWVERRYPYKDEQGG